MQPPSRPQNRSDGSTAVTARGESEGDPPVVGAAGAPAQNPSSKDSGERSLGHLGSTGEGEPDSPPRCRTIATSPGNSLGVFQKRSIFSYPRRSSSGYFSFDSDSLPTSPLSPRPATAERTTQTPSPTSQVMKHALQRMAEAHGGGARMQQQQHESSPSPSSTRQRNAAGDMQAEAVGQELRRIGDDFNRLLLLRGVAGGHRHVVIHPNQLPQIHQEPAVLLCVGLLLLVIGRIIYYHSSTNSPDHSQV